VNVANIMDAGKDKTRRLFQYSFESKTSAKVNGAVERIVASKILNNDVRCLPVLLFALFDEDLSTLIIHADVSCINTC